MEKEIVIGIISVILMSNLITGCKTESQSTTATQTYSTGSQVFTSASYITATSISELANKSTLIVIGKAIKIGNVINMARDIDDISKPDPNLFGIGQIYEFEVTRYLKGEQNAGNAEKIFIVQPEGMIVLSSRKQPSLDDIEKARAEENYIPISLGKEYILFLVPLEGFSELLLHYTGVAQPWRFDISDPARVMPDSPWAQAGHFFPPQALDTIILQIEHPELLPYPYPPPPTPVWDAPYP